LACNALSIKTKKGLFVLAYRNLNLDIKSKVLRTSKNLFINKEFSYDPDTKDVRNVESIYRYLPEEEYHLLEDAENNLKNLSEWWNVYEKQKNFSNYYGNCNQHLRSWLWRCF
jgi:hypothetical protein